MRSRNILFWSGFRSTEWVSSETERAEFQGSNFCWKPKLDKRANFGLERVISVIFWPKGALYVPTVFLSKLLKPFMQEPKPNLCPFWLISRVHSWVCILTYLCKANIEWIRRVHWCQFRLGGGRHRSRIAFSIVCPKTNERQTRQPASQPCASQLRLGH